MRIHRDTQNRYDSVEILIHSIRMHHSGNPKEFYSSFEMILINLRCPTRDDYN